MNATCKLILRKSYSRKDKTHPVYLRVTINRKSKYYSMEIWCKVEQWDEKKRRLYKTVENSVIHNIKLVDKETKAQSILNNFNRFDKPPTFIEFKTQFNDNFSKDNFYELASKYIKNNKQLSKESRRTYESQLTKLNQFQNVKALTINEINNLDFIQAYKNYMIEQLDNKINTIAKSLGFIKSVINYAITHELIQTNVFSKIKIKKELGKREYLTSPELKILEDYYYSNSINNSQKNILSYYLFCCYTGLRFKDVKNLCWKDIIDNKTVNYQTGNVENWKTIEIKMHKTQIDVTIPLNKKALEYLPERNCKKETDDIFRVISGDKTNKFLRKALDKAKIKKSSPMSFHTSRHTFATYALVCGMPIKFISKLLGHTDIKTTQIYTKVNKDSLINSVRDLNNYF